MVRSSDAAIAGQARTMLGLLTTSQLTTLGVTRQQRRTLVQRRVLVPAGARVFRHAAWPTSWEQSALAAVLASGEGAVVSHAAAAVLWHLEGFAPGAISLTVPVDRRPRAVAVVIHRSCDLVPADVDRRRLIPRTTPARTLIDIAADVTAGQLEGALDAAERDGLVWRPHLRWRLDQLRRRGRRGAPELDALLERTEGRPLGDSWLEREALRLIARAGLPVPACQVRLRTPGGIARVDLTWHDANLVAELDGHATHATRRRRQSDAERAASLGLAGWRVVRFTYEDITERPGYVVDTIRRYLHTT